MNPATRVRNVKLIAGIITALVVLVAYLSLSGGQADINRTIDKDACSRGRETSLKCRAQTCARLEAVGGHATLCHGIKAALAGRAASAAGSSGRGDAGKTSSGGGTPTGDGQPGATGGGGGGSSGGSGSQPPGATDNAPAVGVSVQTPDLPVAGRPGICLNALGQVVANINC